jgi:hypothetical protein
MRDQQDNGISNYAQRPPSNFAVYNPILLNYSVRIVEDLHSIIEIDAMLASAALRLRLIPRKRKSCQPLL